MAEPIVIRVNRNLPLDEMNSLVEYYSKSINCGFIILTPDCELIEPINKKTPKSNWICFNDSYPEEGAHIVFYNKINGQIGSDYFSEDFTLMSLNEDLSNLFWMPFPEFV